MAFIDSLPLALLTNYDGLIGVTSRWLDRPDLGEQVPDFIKLAEARFRRLLVMPVMETEIAFAGAAVTPLPADYDSLRSLVITSPCQAPMTPMAPADFYRLPTNVAGMPCHFLIAGTNIKSWPAPDQTYTGLLTYRANLPGLSPQVETNWLLDKHPDAYLCGVLLQAEFYGWNDERLPLIKGALDEIMGEIMLAGNRQRYGGGPLTMRAPVREGARW